MILFYTILAFFVLGSCYIVYRSRPETRPFTMLWAYSVISAAAVGVYPYLNVTGHPHALTALALLIAVPGFVCVMWTVDGEKRVLNLLASVMYLNAGITFYNGWGFANAGSFDAAIFMAAMPIFASIPIFGPKNRPYLFHIAFAVLFMLWTRSNTGAMILASYAVFYGFREAISKNWKSLIGVVGVLGTAVISLLIKGGASGSARVEGWKHYIQMLFDNGYQYFGTGIGTFQGMAPLLPEVLKTQEVFLYMHNDYAQMLFEGGLVGLIWLLLCVWHLFFFTTKISLKFAVIGMAVCMISYSPLHVIVGQFCVSVLVLTIINERKNDAISKRN